MTTDRRPKRSPDYRRLVELSKQEIDAAFSQAQETLARSYFVQGDWVPSKPTRRQRLGLALWRLRRTVARPLVWALRLLDPSALDEDERSWR